MKLLLVLSLLPLLSLHAADPATQLAERGKLLFSDDFNQLNTKAWRIAKGKWEIAEGALHGAEIPADKHGGVLRHPLSFTDAIIQYDIRLDGAKTSTLSINDAKEHVARVLVSPTGFAAQKDDHDHDGPDTAISFGRKAAPFKAGEWHTVVAELLGDTLVATVDGANPIAGSHASLAVPKANFGFTVTGESVSLRNVRVWEATAKPDAAQIKQKLVKTAPVAK